MSYCIFNLVLWGMIVLAEDTYNFPLQSNQPNTMFLEDYTPSKFKAPLYQLERNNEYNLSIQQSVVLLQEGKLSLNGKILSASNYISDSQLSSNNFWVLTKNNLYQGLLQNNGSLIFNQLSINLSQLSCFYINLLTESMGLISCMKSNYLNFVLANYSNSQIQIYPTNFTFPKKYSNRKINLQYVNENTFYIYLTYVTKENASVICFSYYLKQLQQISLQVYDGPYIQALLSQDFNQLFLMSKKSVYIINMSSNNSLREIANYKTTTRRLKEHFTKMAVYQVSKNIYHIVLLQNKYLSQLYFDTRVQFYSENQKHFTLNPYEKVIQLVVNLNSIYLITNNYITKLDSVSTIEPKNYLNYSLANMALIQLERQITILIETSEQSTTFQSILFNKPQIQINLSQTQQIVNNFQAVKLKIKINSQFSREIEEFLLLNIIITDITQSQCPISYSNDFPTANLVYPQVKTIKGNQMMLGPNITTTITSSEKSYLNVSKSNIMKYTLPSDETYSSMCTIYRSYTITCSQSVNEIRISYSQSLSVFKFTYFVIPVNFNQSLVQCTCSQTILQVEVLMQFTNYVLIQIIDYQLLQQGLFQYQLNQQILSAAFLEDTLFVITNDNILSAYSTNNLKTPKFTVSNYQFTQIYLNKQNYPNYLFIDNQQNLVILSYKGQESCQFVNQIAYPQPTYEEIQLGILNNGIYIAIINNSKNIQLYYYPIQSIYINSQIQTYYELNLLGYQFAFSNLQTAYTQRNFYIILYKSTSVYWAQYYGSGSSFVSLVQSNWIQTFSSQNYISSISVVEDEQESQEIEYLLISNTKLEYKKYVITDWTVALIPLYQANQLSVQTQIKYNASNQQCYNLQQQDVTILFEKKVILPRLSDQEKNIVELSINQSQFQVNPLELFNGNIDNYTVTCNNCQQFNYTQPISNENQVQLNVYLQGLVKLNETFLYVQNNVSVYLMEFQTGQLTKLYDFPKQMEACFSLFVELVTLFPISICSNSIVYSYNITSNTIIQNSLSYLNSLFLKNYNNGILQILSFTNNIYYNYYQFYVQIQENQIILTQIYSFNKIQQVYNVDLVILKLSSNFTSDPCQTMGFSFQFQANQNPKFYILKTCMPSSFAQYFGFPGNQYTEITNVYFSIQEWRLMETQIASPSVSNYVQQVGLPININDYISQLLIACPYSNDMKIYRIQFNLTDGSIIGFQFAGSLFLDFSKVYLFRTANNLIIIDVAFEVNGNQSVNLYLYNVENLLYSNMQVIPYITQFYSVFNSYRNFVQNQGDYYLTSGKYDNKSLIIKLQNSLIFNVSLQENEQEEIEIIAQNQQNQCQRSLVVMKEQNNDDNDDDDNDDDDNDNDDDNNNDNDENDDNDDDNDDDDDDIVNPNQKYKSRLIIIVAISVVLLIIIIVIIILCCRKKGLKKNSNEMSYQLV